MLSGENSLNIRSGLPGISGALSQGVCKIALLGNSVSAQKEGYWLHLKQNINNHFGHTFQFVNASLGGIGSLACSFLVDDFVLRHKPDICFVECSTADIGCATPLQFISPAIEGIINQLQLNNIKVCLVYLYRDKDDFFVREKVTAIYEQVANHYKIPSINIHEAITELISDGKFIPEEIVYDGVHTTPEGAVVTGELLFDAFTEIIQPNNHTQTAGITALNINAFHFTNIFPATLKMLSFREAGMLNRYRGLISYLQFGRRNELTLIPEKCELTGIMVIAGPDSGVVTIENNNVISNIQLFDEWCEKERIQAIILNKPHPSGLPLKISIADISSCEQGANGSPNAHIKKAESLKVIGFMLRYYDENYVKTRLWQ